MKGMLLARVRRVLMGHSERGFVDAVDDAGRELKLEVPAEAVRDVEVGQEYVLTLAWSLHPAPRIPELVPGGPPSPALGEPASPTETTPPPSAGSSVDEQFMALMARGRRPAEPEPPAAASAPSPAPSPPLRPEQQLAARLGLGVPS